MTKILGKYTSRGLSVDHSIISWNDGEMLISFNECYQIFKRILVGEEKKIKFFGLTFDISKYREPTHAEVEERIDILRARS